MHWVFLAAHGFSLAAGSKGYSLIAVSELLISHVGELGF